MNKLIVVTGPTTAGKSRLAVELSKKIDGEVISADSMQVYRHMDIGTAKITKEEMQGIPHHLIDCVEPTEDFNVFKFKELASAALEDIYARKKMPVMTGGTGFYIQSVLYDIDFSEEKADKPYQYSIQPDSIESVEELHTLSKKGLISLRQFLEYIALTRGPQVLHDALSELDPESAMQIHENNVKRVIRAIEYFDHTGNCISAHNLKMREKDSPYDFRYYCLYRQPAEIYYLIEQRVDKMIQDGFIDEVQALMDMGLTDKNVSMQGIGYRQMYRYLKGDYSKNDAIAMMKRDTKHYAKRQFTWFRREKNVQMINFQNYKYDYDKVVDFILEDMG